MALSKGLWVRLRTDGRVGPSQQVQGYGGQLVQTSNAGLRVQAMLPAQQPAVAGLEDVLRPQGGNLFLYRNTAMTRLPHDAAQRNHELQCRQLGRTLVQVWGDRSNDLPLANIVVDRFTNLQQQDRPSRQHMTVASQAFLQLTYWNMDTRGTFAWLLNSAWDLQTAVEEYMQHRFQVDGAPASERSVRRAYGEEEPSLDESDSPSEDEGESEEGDVEEYVDEDPENIDNLPEDIEVEDYVEPESGESMAAVRYADIRHFLIDQAATGGRYKYGRQHMPDDEKHSDDQTSFLKTQRRWGFHRDNRSQYPPIIFVFERKDRPDPQYPNDDIPHMRWRGLLVIDHEGQPVRRFRNIPAALSSQIEGGLMEAIQREDSRIRNNDFLARMPQEWWKQKTDGTWVPHPMTVNTLASRLARWRERIACLSWEGRTQAMKPYDRWLRDNLPQALLDANNTRGLARNRTPWEQSQMKTNDKLSHIIVEFVLADEFPRGRGDKAKSFYHPEKEHDCRDCMPQGLDDLAALNDALLITVAHFINLTGKCPRLPLGRNTYRQVLSIIDQQLQNDHITGRLLRHPPLRQIGRWTGGIARWRCGAIRNP